MNGNHAARFLKICGFKRGKFKTAAENKSSDHFQSSTRTTRIKLSVNSMEGSDLRKESFKECKDTLLIVKTTPECKPDDPTKENSQPSPDSSDFSQTADQNSSDTKGELATLLVANLISFQTKFEFV